MLRPVVPALALAVTVACAHGPAPTPVPMTTISDVEWTLTQLGERTAPVGARGEAPSLRFDADGSVSGYGGCNRVRGPYTVAGDRLTFGNLAMTMMACPDGMDLERDFARALGRVTRWARAGDVLTLSSDAGPVATFRAR